MVRWSVTTAFAVVLVAVLGGASHSAGSIGANSAAPLPLLGSPPSLTLERDLPPVVRARIVRVQRRLLALAKRGAKDRVRRANRCVPSTSTLRPRIRASTRGAGGPSSPGKSSSRGYHDRCSAVRGRSAWSSTAARGELNPDADFGVATPRGRVVVMLLLYGHPPYDLHVYSESLYGRPGPTVKIPLRCPGTGNRVKGCLRPRRPGATEARVTASRRHACRAALLARLRVAALSEASRLARGPGGVSLLLTLLVRDHSSRSRLPELAVPCPLRDQRPAGTGLLARVPLGRVRKAALRGRGRWASDARGLRVLAPVIPFGTSAPVATMSRRCT